MVPVSSADVRLRRPSSAWEVCSSSLTCLPSAVTCVAPSLGCPLDSPPNVAAVVCHVTCCRSSWVPLSLVISSTII
ncbi:unnamed protein product, partial [Citrullus colocynthis]